MVGLACAVCCKAFQHRDPRKMTCSPECGREHKRRREREYLRTHREQRTEYKREYARVHREQERAYARKSYAKHRERRIADQREYRSRNRELVIESQRATRRKYRERYAEKRRARSKHPIGSERACLACGASFLTGKSTQAVCSDTCVVFRASARRAKTRGIDFSLSPAWFAANVYGKPCHYCGADVSYRRGASGMDRVDSRLGYVQGNVVPCCKRCNIAKNDVSLDEFIAMAAAIVSRHCAGPDTQ